MTSFMRSEPLRACRLDGVDSHTVPLHELAEGPEPTNACGRHVMLMAHLLVITDPPGSGKPRHGLAATVAANGPASSGL
jgi:hypothetical protein